LKTFDPGVAPGLAGRGAEGDKSRSVSTMNASASARSLLPLDEISVEIHAPKENRTPDPISKGF